MKRLIIIVIALFLLSGCGKENSEEGTYVDFGEHIYYELRDGKYITNDVKTIRESVKDTGDGVKTIWDSDAQTYSGTYAIQEGKVKLEVTEKGNIDLGYPYKNFLCRKYIGYLPKNYNEETSIVFEITRVGYVIHFFEDKYEFRIYTNDSEEYTIFHKGTYVIEKDQVTCIPDAGSELFLFDIGEGEVYFAELLKK